MRMRDGCLKLHDDSASSLHSLGQLAIEDCARARDAITHQNAASAAQIIAGDKPIHQAHVALEACVVTEIATRQPPADDLRRLLSAITIVGELGRIADTTNRIARVASVYTGYLLLHKIPVTDLGDQALQLLRVALVDVAALDDTARPQFAQVGDLAGAQRPEIRKTLIGSLHRDPPLAGQVVDLCVIMASLERIADRATTIVERVFSLVSGEAVVLTPSFQGQTSMG